MSMGRWVRRSPAASLPVTEIGFQGFRCAESDPEWLGAACELRLSLPGLVSLRRAVGSATGPLIRPGPDLLLTAAVLVPATPALSFLLPRTKHLP